jgi:hypothetical protein
MMLRDLYREGRDIDAARLRAEHDREHPQHDRFIATRNSAWTHIRRSLFGFSWPVWRYRRR